MKVKSEILIESYSRLQNVWKVADEVGLCGQSVHERLVKMGVINKMNYFTKEDKERLIVDYEKYLLDGKLEDLATEMGRTKAFICRQAQKLGLTDLKREKSIIKTFKPSITKGFWDNREHPRGFSGHRHTDEAKEVISEKSILTHKEINNSGRRGEISMRMMKSRVNNGGYAPERQKTTWKSGWRTIGGIKKYFRSRWEANYARYLQLLKETGGIINWEHEPKVFYFEAVKRGCMSYLPDFRVTMNDNSTEYHEVKGWMDDRSMVKIARMKQYYPEVLLKIIREKWFKENNKSMADKIKDWED